MNSYTEWCHCQWPWVTFRGHISFDSKLTTALYKSFTYLLTFQANVSRNIVYVTHRSAVIAMIGCHARARQVNGTCVVYWCHPQICSNCDDWMSCTSQTSERDLTIVYWLAPLLRPWSFTRRRSLAFQSGGDYCMFLLCIWIERLVRVIHCHVSCSQLNNWSILT